MKADFALLLHFHQPVGNFDHVIERACDKCYIPFLEMLEKFPDIKMSINLTGCLLEWVEEKRPSIISMLKDMVERGRIEMVSGGFYEPILPSIPPADRLLQIKMLNEYIQKRFSYNPQGAWIAERVWEPLLASCLYDAGIKYTILDDTHFLYSGVRKNDTYGYYVTEDNGKTLFVFPSDKVLRYMIPFRMPNECTSYMRSVMEREDNPLFVYGDDGEKFGEWPGTHKWVYEEAWLEKFFNELMQNREWLTTVKLSECIEKRQPKGRVYFGTTSYEEMLEWSLPAELQIEMKRMLDEIKTLGKEDFYRPFIRGGFWRNFFSKYPESNHMNKKMIYVSKKLNELKGEKKKSQKFIEAEKELLRGQCNCAYWHGVFGGLYLFHLRRAIYHHLIKSEAIIDDINYGKKDFCEAHVFDIDADGKDDGIILENKTIALYFSPLEGGALKEIDSKKICQNLINSLSRKKEAYHAKVIEKIQSARDEGQKGIKTIHDDIQAPDEHLVEFLNYDWYSRYSLIDHFISNDEGIESFSRCAYKEYGSFVKGHYAFNMKEHSNGITLLMDMEGLVDDSKVYLAKESIFPKKGASFKVNYKIINYGDRPIDVRFGPEFNITMPDADSERYALMFDKKEEKYSLGELVSSDNVKSIKIQDNDNKLSFIITLSEKCEVWHFPVKTVSQSERAYELNYQSSAIFPHIPLKLNPEEIKHFGLEITLGIKV